MMQEMNSWEENETALITERREVAVETAKAEGLWGLYIALIDAGKSPSSVSVMFLNGFRRVPRRDTIVWYGLFPNSLICL